MTTQIANEIKKVSAPSWLESEYFVYANYVVKNRALVDSDGLKPVVRRILWTLFVNNWTHNHPFVKAIKVSGACCGSFHPHGDASISDALARMCQSFQQRIPYCEPFGSVGANFGDTAAAPRYVEVRLSKAGLELVKETKEFAVPIGTNFDGTEPEPAILPVRWPANIINGTQGIAVGFASQIPAHNPDETIDAAIALIDNSELSVDELLEIMPGPDFPTGGEVLEIDGIKQYYETGQGRFLMRPKYHTKQLPGGRTQIVFTELPYGVSPDSIISRVHDLRTPQEKKVKGKKTVVVGSPKLKSWISSIKNLSDHANGLRLVVETKQGANPEQVVVELLDKTNLQTYFSVNATVLHKNHPRRLGMLGLLQDFIDTRRICIINKSEFRLSKIKDRLSQLNAILAALLDIDKCIAIIRNSDSPASANLALQSAFNINEQQAEYLLSMQLRRLTKADKLESEQEKNRLIAEQDQLNELLNSGDLIDEQVKKELLETKKIISSPRRTIIKGVTSSEVKAKEKALKQLAKETNTNVDCFISRFANGSIMRTIEPFFYQDMAMSFANSPLVEQFKIKAQDDLVVVLSTGIGYKIPASHLLLGKPCNKVMLGLSNAEGHLVGVGKFAHNKAELGLAVATGNGGIKITAADYPVSKDSFPVISLDEGDQIVNCVWLDKPKLDNSNFVFISKLGKILSFNAKGLKPTGSKAKSIKGISLSNDDELVAFNWQHGDTANYHVLTLSNLGVKHMLLNEVPQKGRGTQGVAVQTFRNKENVIIKAFVGLNPVMAGNNSAYSAIMLPAIGKRAGRSIDLPIDVLFGSSVLTNEVISK